MSRPEDSPEDFKASEERARLPVEGVKDYAIFMLDPNGHVVSWNAGAERITGYQADEIFGRHFSCFYPAAEIAQGKPGLTLEAAIAAGRFEEKGWRVRKDGSRYWAHAVITALFDGAGRLRGIAEIT